MAGEIITGRLFPFSEYFLQFRVPPKSRQESISPAIPCVRDSVHVAPVGAENTRWNTQKGQLKIVHVHIHTLQIQKEHRTSSTPHFFHSVSRAAVLIASSRTMAFHASCMSPPGHGSWRTRSVFWRSGRKSMPHRATKEHGLWLVAFSMSLGDMPPSNNPATQAG